MLVRRNLPAKETAMKAIVTTLAAVLAIMLGTAAAQATQTVQATQVTPATDPQKQMPPEVILTGCVVQGSSPTVFILDNAKKDPASTAEKGVRYLLASVIEDVDLRTHLNHEVRITGEVDAKVSADPVTAPPVPPVPPPPTDLEKALPKLKAKSVTMVSDTCAAVR
jgi:hypothetical protein